MSPKTRPKRETILDNPKLVDASEDDSSNEIPADILAAIDKIGIDASGEGVHPWDRMPGEPMHCYQAFVIYLHSDIPRSIRNTYINYKEIVERNKLPYRVAKVAPLYWYDWRTLWNWDGRAEEYDRGTAERIGNVLEKSRAKAEWKALDILLTSAERISRRIRDIRPEDEENYKLSEAIRDAPKVADAIREHLGARQQGKPKLEDIFRLLPPEYRQQLLIAINVEQVNIGTPALPEDKPENVIEGEVQELPALDSGESEEANATNE